MPFSNQRARNERDTSDAAATTVAEALVRFLYYGGIYALAVFALVICAAAFTVSLGEGIRAILFFMIPSAWGALALALYDGDPKAFQNISPLFANGLAVAGALVVAAVWIIDAPISIANIALGALEAFFFVLRISNQPSSRIRRITGGTRTFVTSLALFVTVLSIVVAVMV